MSLSNDRGGWHPNLLVARQAREVIPPSILKAECLRNTVNTACKSFLVEEEYCKQRPVHHPQAAVVRLVGLTAEGESDEPHRWSGFFG
jgi:hypothetical protein